MKNKNKWLAWVRTLAFLLVLAALLALLNRMIWASQNTLRDITVGLEGEGYDVAFFGASHAEDAFLSTQLYEQQGWTAYNYATQGQSFENTYWGLKEVLDKNLPKVAVVEIFLSAWPYNWVGRIGSLHWTGGIRNMLPDLSRNKWQAAEELKEHWSATDEFYRFPTYRYYWHDLDRAQIASMSEDYPEKSTMGATITMDDWDFKGEVEYAANTDLDAVRLNDDMVAILDRISGLIAEYPDVKFVFAVAPYQEIEVEDKCFELLADYCGQRGIPFWNGQEYKEEMGWDDATCLFDRGHVNLHGAQLTTEAFGNWLKEQVDLPEHRSEEWNEIAEEYEDYLKYRQLERAETVEEFLQLAAELPSDNVVAFCAGEGAVDGMTEDQINALRTFGFTGFGSRDAYAGVLYQGTLQESVDRKMQSLDVLIDGASFCLVPGDAEIVEVDKGSSITIDREQVCSEKAIQLAVYSLRMGKTMVKFQVDPASDE